MRKFLFAAAFVVLGYSTTQAATDEPPKITKDFLVFCRTHASVCDDEIMAIHVSTVLYVAQTRSPLGYCYPTATTRTTAGVKKDDGRNQVVDESATPTIRSEDERCHSGRV